MAKISVKIGQTYLDTKTLKLRSVRSVLFGNVVYDVYVKAANGWVTQVMPYYLFKNNIANGRYVFYQGKRPKVEFVEIDN